MIHPGYTYARLQLPAVRSGRLLIVLGLVALLTACGGGGDDGGSLLPPPATGTVPTITAQPQSQTAMTGDTVTLNVVASGTGPFTYQWRRGLLSIPGATGPSYTTDPLTLSDSGAAISVSVSNAAGRVFSDVVLLTVNANPAGLYFGTFTAAGENTSLPMLAMVLRDGTVAAFVTLENFTTNVPIGLALANIRVEPSGSLFSSGFTAYTQAGFALDDGTSAFKGKIGGNIFPGDAIIGSVESDRLSGDFRLNVLKNDYERAASAAAIAGTYQHSYVVRFFDDSPVLIDATTTYDTNGAGVGTDGGGCSVSSTTTVPDATRNVYTIVTDSTCAGRGRSLFNGLMTLFPAGSGAEINGGVDFPTDTLVSIADDGATGYLVIARK